MPDNPEAQPGRLIQMPSVPTNNDVGVFASPAAFEHGQRMARALASSTMVPTQYRDNLPNVLVALDVAMRAKLPPMMVLQGLNIIQGRPSWSSQFIVAAVNGCGLFSPLRYEMRGEEGTDSWGCRAVARELATNTPLDGPWVTIGMARAEGWYGRSGSKWQTLPEIMLRWRAASFFGRLYAAHILAGMASTEELRDAGEIELNPRAPETPVPLGQPFGVPFTPPAPAADPAPAPAEVVPARRRGRPPRVDPPAGEVPETPAAARAREAAAAEPLPIPQSGLEPAPPRAAVDPLDPGF